MKTLDYYNENAEAFSKQTKNADMSMIYRRFLPYVPKNGKILDLGCGSGRDTKYFLSLGYDVDALDGSEELCRIASVYTGIVVKHLLFSELSETEKYDAVWACASLLHIKKEELNDVINKVIKSLKSEGILYMSFKEGEVSGERNGRYFSNFIEDSMRSFLKEIPSIDIVEFFISGDVREGRSSERWLNIIVRKKYLQAE